MRRIKQIGLVAHDDDAEAWLKTGTALDERGRPQEAVEAYTKATELKPDWAEAWLNRGIALDELGRHHEAIEAFLKAIELNPDYAEVW